MNLKNGKVFTSKFVWTGPSSYEKRIYQAAVSQRLRNTAKRDGEQKPDAVSTTEKEPEIHQQRNQIYKWKEEIESAYYQVTQTETDKRPRLQKLQNMFKIKAIMQTANEAMEETLDGIDLNITELNHLIYAAAVVITE